METRAYPQCYVSDAAITLAVAIDYATFDCGLSAGEFMELFIQSGVADLFEEGSPALISGMSGVELVHAVHSYVYGSSDWPVRRKADGLSAEYWVGWVLAQYQWYSTRRFADIVRVVPVEEVLGLYPLYHEADITRFYEAMDDIFEERTASIGVHTRLKDIRTARGLSQQQLADASGVKVRNIQMYEQGHNNINHASTIALYRMAHVLGCTIEDLLENPTL